MARQLKNRRAVLTGLGVVATAGALGTPAAGAQGASAPFAPALHAQDAWMSAMRGRHRVVLDVTSPSGVPDAIRFAGNLFNGNKTGYGVEEADLAIIICLRHAATAYGYADATWAKHGKVLDAAATPAPVVNPSAAPLAALAKRGAQFMVCGTASRGIAGRIAAAQGGDAEAILKEMATNLMPSGRIVVAGVVGVTHAQDHGFAILHVG